MTNWSDDEVFRLISIWSDEEIQALLESSRRNQAIFERIAREMGAAGFHKSPAQCKDKIKKLKNKYKKLKDDHDISGTNRHNWPFFDKMDEVLGTRHSVQPPVTIDTSLSHHDDDDDEVLTETTTQSDVVPGNIESEPIESPMSPSTSVPANTTATTTTVTATSSAVLPTTTSTTNASTVVTSSSSSSIRKKGKSPKKRARKGDAIEKAVDKLARLQEASDDRFFTLEEKRLKVEERMMSTLQSSMKFFQQAMLSMPSYGGYYPPGPSIPPPGPSSTATFFPIPSAPVTESAHALHAPTETLQDDQD